MTVAGIRRDRFRFVPLDNHAPDPRDATSPAEFVEQLRRLKAWSDRTYRRLEKEAARRGHALPHSTIATALARRSLPRTELVAALVSACGCDEETVALWVDARRRLSASEVSAPSPADPAPGAEAAIPSADTGSPGTEPTRPPGEETTTPPGTGTARPPGGETTAPSGAVAAAARGSGRVRRLGRPARLAAVLLAGLLVAGASPHPPDVRRPVSRPSRPDGTSARLSANGSRLLPLPAAWWRFEETGGPAAWDSSGHGRNATIGGDAVRAAMPGGGHALALAGNGHAVTHGPVVRTDEAFTITAWARLDGSGDWGTVVSDHGAGRDADVVLLDYDADHREWAFLMPDRRKGWAMGDETVFSGRRPVPGRWTHLAAVHDPAGRRVCLYVDGRLEACRTRASLTRAAGPLDIGRALADGEPVDGWHGAIDDVRVFAGALTGAQIHEVASDRA